MKVRTGFVSNSSSSSFVCDVCNKTDEAQNIGLDDVEMVQCVNGHVFCEEHAIGDINRFNHILTCDEYDEDYYEDFRYETPKEFCPICNLVTIPKDTYTLYLQRMSKKTKEEHLNDIRCRFRTYSEFMEFLKERSR